MTKKKKVESKAESQTESEYWNSKEFIVSFRETVKRHTWGQGLPMVYANEKGEIVKHWEDGKIEVIGNLKK